MACPALALALVVGGLALGGCHGAQAAPAGEAAVITVAGSSSLQAFAQDWGQAFQRQPGAAPVSVQGGGSTTGVRLVASGAMAVAAVSRPLRPDERAGLAATPVAHDAIAIVVSQAHPLAGLRLDQVRAILAGRVTRWSDVGGPDRAIHVVTREHGSGTRAEVEELALRGEPITDGALVGEATEVVSAILQGDADAIGYLSLGQVGGGLRALALDGVAPTEETIRQGRYPLVRPLLLVTRDPRPAAAARFIDFVLSPEGQSRLRAQGFLPVRP